MSDPLTQLEQQAIFVLRESLHSFDSLVMPWSMGKDSNVLVWLARKAFFGKVPFPVLHVDTGYEFPEMYRFREWAAGHHGLDLIVCRNEEAIARGVGYATHDALTVTHELKTLALQQALAKGGWQALVTGIRRDEDPTRAKERCFSPRNRDHEWAYKEQPPEFWNYFTTRLRPGETVRVQPLLEWTEIDVWRYIQRERIPVPSLYFSRDGRRHRSLGCWPITHPVPSQASTIDEIIAELATTRSSERAGRTQQDQAERNAMQKLRAKGFF